MPATPVWLAAVESVLNRAIGRSQRALAAARRLNGTSVRIDIERLSSIRAAVCGERLALTAGGGEAADASIRGSPLALARLIGAEPAAERGAGRFGSGAARGASAQVAGDAEIAGRYRELFALARPDLEEELSRLIGDLPARRVSLIAEGAWRSARRAARTAGENLAEYLQHESRDLASRPEIEEFTEGVDRLRDLAERVEARLARVEQRLKDAP